MTDEMFLGNTYQANVIRTDLTRALPVIVPELVDESALALQEVLEIPEGSGTMPTRCLFGRCQPLTIRIRRLGFVARLAYHDAPDRACQQSRIGWAGAVSQQNIHASDGALCRVRDDLLIRVAVLSCFLTRVSAFLLRTLFPFGWRKNHSRRADDSPQRALLCGLAYLRRQKGAAGATNEAPEKIHQRSGRNGGKTGVF